MDPYLKYLNSLIDKSKEEFSGLSPVPDFINYSKSYEAEELRLKLIQKLENKIEWLFQNTKPFLNTISEGCRHCGQGEWSCLFITGLCNANCFYCPASQKEDHLPTTQSLEFKSAGEYAEYLKFMDFKGMSISGGEPFLFFERTLDYIGTARNVIGNELYIWMYTNGIAGTKERFAILVEAGLNEVRFDIGATGYSTEYLKNASGIVPVITVEIPAVPEETERLKQVLPELVKLGVKNLNFHQIRLTRHNYDRVVQRNYTFLHGERVTVLESELAALEIMNYVAENKINIGVNYCAFQYKSRFQKAGYRKKTAKTFANTGETITENGFIRTISVLNTPETISFLKNNKVDGWSVLNNSIFINLSILKNLKDKINAVEINYFGITMEEGVIDKHGSLLNKDTKSIQALACNPITIPKDKLNKFLNLISTSPETPPADPLLFDVWRMEYIESGWRGYF